MSVNRHSPIQILVRTPKAVPRGYDRPRSLERRAAEQRLLQGVPVGPESVPRGVPSGRRDYNKVVR